MNHQKMMFKFVCPICKRWSTAIMDIDEYEVYGFERFLCQWCHSESKIKWEFRVFCFAVNEGRPDPSVEIYGSVWPENDPNREVFIDEKRTTDA